MFIKKKSKGYDQYDVEMSYAELMALQAAGRECGDPIGDECAKAIDWFFAHEVPPPGVDEHPDKAEHASVTGSEADELLVGAGAVPAEPAGPDLGDESALGGPSSPEDPEADVKITPPDADIDAEAEELLPKA